MMCPGPGWDKGHLITAANSHQRLEVGLTKFLPLDECVLAIVMFKGASKEFERHQVSCSNSILYENIAKFGFGA